MRLWKVRGSALETVAWEGEGGWIAFDYAPDGPFCVADTSTGVATFYDRSGNTASPPVTIPAAAVDPPGTPGSPTVVAAPLRRGGRRGAASVAGAGGPPNRRLAQLQDPVPVRAGPEFCRIRIGRAVG